MRVEALVFALNAFVGDVDVPTEAGEGDPSAAPEVLSSLPLDAGPKWRVLGGAAIGRGLRFNNPYRLETQLGDTAESLSLTALYVDLSVGAAFDAPGPLQHGAIVHGSIATQGIRQEVVSPSYAVFFDASPRWLVSGRFGLPVVIEPDLNLGWEVGVGAGFFLTAGVALTAELVAAFFYGAATLDVPRTTVPVAALQLGVLFDYEVMP